MKIKSFATPLSLLVILTLSLLAFPSLAPAKTPKPELYFPVASPTVVQIGEQPEESPLVLSVRVKLGAAQITQVEVNLSELFKAEYYDPNLDIKEEVSIVTPMFRVYRVGGKYAYRVDGKHKQVLTHKNVKGTAVATNRWQVELPNVGQVQKSFELKVTATNKFNQSGTATILLQVINDVTAPEIFAEISYLFGTSAARPGDKVIIKAEASDELTEVVSVRLADEAEEVFGQGANLALLPKDTTNSWELENKLARTITPGTYMMHLFALDRAGNEAVTTIKVEVVKEITSFQIKLSEGWNLISVPKQLENPAVSEVFAGLPIGSVRTYAAGGWVESEEIKPGLGYLVKVDKDCELVLEFRNYDPSVVPLTIKLDEGWNLVGYASPTLEPMMPLTFYFEEDLKGNWLVVYNESGEQARAWPRKPYVWATDRFPTITDEPCSEDPSHNLPRVELGKGYWIYLEKEGVLVP